MTDTPLASSLDSPRTAGWFRADMLAGLTVALVGLPQCLAYAMMAGLPPEYGLATAAVPGLIAAVFGRACWVTTGPTNTTGLLILVALTPFLAAGSGLLQPQFLSILAVLTLLAGALRLALAVSGGFRLVRFVPESTLIGFTAGAGILIGVMQLDEALGLPPIRAGNLVQEFSGIGSVMEHATVAWPAMLVCVLSIAGVAVGRRYLKRWPMTLIVVLAASLIAMIFDLTRADGLPVVMDRATMPGGWPAGAMPWELFQSPPTLNGTVIDPWQQLLALIVPAIAIVVLGTMELLVTTRIDGANVNINREIRAQGLANIAGAFASAHPASASLTRSALLRQSGARTQLAPLVAAAVIVPLMFFGGALVNYIPQASLAGVLLITAWGMIDRSRIARMWAATPATRVLMVVTMLATLFLPLAWAIIVGTGLGLLIHLAQGGAPRVRALVVRDDRLVAPAADERPEGLILEVSGNLHYAAVEPFMVRVRALLTDRSKWIVIDLSHAHQVRMGAMEAMERLQRELAARGSIVALAGVRPRFAAMLERTNSTLMIEADDPEPGASARRSLQRLIAGGGGRDD